MSEVRQELEDIRMRPVRSARDAGIVEEAARFLGELADVEHRAAEWVSRVSRDGPGVADRTLSGITLHEAARRVLEEAGVPLHARELGARIKAAGWRHPRSPNARPEQIVFQLAARLPRYPHLFRRVGPNTFGLAEWGGESPRKRKPPRLDLFRGQGNAIGRASAESDEPFSQGSPWRSS